MAGKKKQAFVAGGVPRVNLLPQDARVKSELDALKRGVFYSALVAALAVGGAWYYTWTMAESAEAALKAEQGKTDALISAKKSFSEIPDILNALDTGTRALQAVDEHAVDWSPLIQSILNADGDVAITSISINGNSVTSQGAAASGHYLTTKVDNAHITVTVQGRQVSAVTEWAESVKQVAGFGEYWTGKYSVRAADKTVIATFDLYFDEQVLRSEQRKLIETNTEGDSPEQPEEVAR